MQQGSHKMNRTRHPRASLIALATLLAAAPQAAFAQDAEATDSDEQRNANDIIVNGKLAFVNVMVSPHDTGNGLRWQATTDNGRGDVNTIPRVPLFTPHASREELEARLLAHFGKEATQPGKEATQPGKEATQTGKEARS